MISGNESKTSDPGHAGLPDASAPPLRESLAWGRPIIMNAPEELMQAFEELRAGRIIKE